MPIPMPSRAPAGPPRRALLSSAFGTGAAVLLAGCSDAGEPARARRTSQALKLREQTARECDSLLARYDATLDAHPALAERLRPLRAEIAWHARAFVAAEPSPKPPAPDGPAREAAGPAAPKPESPKPGPRKPGVPADEKKALAALAAAERRTADARTTELLDAPPELSRLLASVAAAGAVHVYLLTEGG